MLALSASLRRGSILSMDDWMCASVSLPHCLRCWLIVESPLSWRETNSAAPSTSRPWPTMPCQNNLPASAHADEPPSGVASASVDACDGAKVAPWISASDGGRREPRMSIGDGLGPRPVGVGVSPFDSPDGYRYPEDWVGVIPV